MIAPVLREYHSQLLPFLEDSASHLTTGTGYPSPFLNATSIKYWKSGGTLLVAQLVEALRYKPEGRGFDSRWCH
jgi:hypothetical protein